MRVREERDRRGSIGVLGNELAIVDERDLAVLGEAERLRNVVPGPGDQPDRDQRGDDQGKGDEERHEPDPGLGAKCELHGEPPFGEPPGRQRARTRRPREHACEQALRLADLRVRVQPGGEEEVELVGLRGARGHAGLPPRANGCRASESSAARMVCVARWSLERTVPRGTPRTSAASSSE